MPASVVSVAPSYHESRPPRRPGLPMSAVAPRVVVTIGSDPESSNGITEFGHQSIWGGCSASQSSRAVCSVSQRSTSRRTSLPQPLESACAGTYMIASVGAEPALHQCGAAGARGLFVGVGRDEHVSV